MDQAPVGVRDDGCRWVACEASGWPEGELGEGSEPKKAVRCEGAAGGGGESPCSELGGACDVRAVDVRGALEMERNLFAEVLEGEEGGAVGEERHLHVLRTEDELLHGHAVDEAEGSASDAGCHGQRNWTNQIAKL